MVAVRSRALWDREGLPTSCSAEAKAETFVLVCSVDGLRRNWLNSSTIPGVLQVFQDVTTPLPLKRAGQKMLYSICFGLLHRRRSHIVKESETVTVGKATLQEYEFTCNFRKTFGQNKRGEKKALISKIIHANCFHAEIL